MSVKRTIYLTLFLFSLFMGMACSSPDSTENPNSVAGPPPTATSPYNQSELAQVVERPSAGNLNQFDAAPPTFTPTPGGPLPGTPTATPRSIRILPSIKNLNQTDTNAPISEPAILTIEPTLEPTQAAGSAVEIPPGSVPVEANLPAFNLIGATENLYFIADGSLVRWLVDSAETETIIPADSVSGGLGAAPAGIFAGPGPLIYGTVAVTDFEVSANGATILVERGLEVADGVTYEIGLFDIASKTYTPIDINPTSFGRLWVAQDGGWAAFTRDNGAGASIQAIQTDQPSTFRTIATCPTDVCSLYPSFDADSLVYMDVNGIWRTSLTQTAPEQILATNVGDPLKLAPQAWSASGRFLLLSGELGDESASYLLDRILGIIFEIPFSHGTTQRSQVSWLPQDQLLVLEPTNASDQPDPILTILALDPNSTDLFKEDLRLAIPLDSGIEGGIPTSTFATGPTRAMQFGGLFGLFNGDATMSGLFEFNLEALTAQRINDWPQFGGSLLADSILWASDGSGFVATQIDKEGNESLVFVSAEQNTPIQVLFSAETTACCYQWGK